MNFDQNDKGIYMTQSDAINFRACHPKCMHVVEGGDERLHHGCSLLLSVRAAFDHTVEELPALEVSTRQPFDHT
eukprot:SAG11_NODE_2057_length_3875_cov_3.864936_2_plen_74_part_00